MEEKVYKLYVEVRNGVVYSIYGDKLPIELEIEVKDYNNQEIEESDTAVPYTMYW